MDIEKFKKAMRPKKYLDGNFIVYDKNLPENNHQINSNPDIYQNLVRYTDVDTEDLTVKYDAATGLFSNKDKSMVFKNISDARKWNDTFKPYLNNPKQTQSRLKVKPKVKPKATINFSKINFEPLPLNNNQRDYQILDQKFHQLEQEITNQQLQQSSAGINGLRTKVLNKFNKKGNGYGV